MMKTTDTHRFAVDNPHSIDADEIIRKLETSKEGLSAAEVVALLAKVGPNKLPEPQKDGILKHD